MRTLGKWMGRGLLGAALICAALWVFGPYEDSDLTASFDASQLEGEGGVQAYFDKTEAQFDDITPGVAKQVVWHGTADARTEWVVLNLHGFSATSQEIRPVPDRVADALGANLVFTRLTGHGRGAAPMAETSVPLWMGDVAEGLAAARAVGDKVIVIGTSTGGTLAAAAAVDAALSKDVEGMVMISPNFAINNPAAPLLTWPAARYWLPVVMGQDRSFDPANEGQATYWTTAYPSVSGLTVGALVKAVDQLDLGAATMPALFIYSDADQVVDAKATDAAMAEWGGATTRFAPTLTDADDDSSHVIAGDILSRAQNQPVTDAITAWAMGL